MSFICAKLIDKVLRALVHATTPTPDLVSFSFPSTSSGYPPALALLYGAIFGKMLSVTVRKILDPAGLAVLSLVLLRLVVSARIVLSGCWMGQIIVSLLLILSPAILVLWVIQDRSLALIE